jgi:hypothetical protein
MTMSSTVSKVTLLGDGVQTSWPFAFKVWQEADIEVILSDPTGADSVALDWSAVLAGLGGTVTYPTSGPPLPLGWKITIKRAMPFLQEVDLVSGTRWDPEVVETALDQKTAELQQLREELSRSVKIGITSSGTAEDLLASIYDARDAAQLSASAAAAQVPLAEDQVALAVAQVALAEGHADDAGTSATEAQGYADNLSGALSDITSLDGRMDTAEVDILALEGAVSDLETDKLDAAEIVAPGDAPKYVCRAWVNFNGSTTPPTIRASGNISSVVKNGTGDYTINFTTPMLDDNYYVGESGAANTTQEVRHVPADIHTVNAVQITCRSNNASTFLDTAYAGVAIFR